MCGVNGIYAYHRAAPPVNPDEVVSTRDAMASRGPDGQGLWRSDDQRMMLAHRRLSMIDLSDAASQPMVSRCGQFVLSYNGEIYNYRELAADLKARGQALRTSSDTEVLLTLLAVDGPRALGRLRGMFALALWDQQQATLLLARDSFGIKPLYVANDGWQLRFASQVKALVAGGQIADTPDPAGQAGFLLTGSVPEPFTTLRQISALPAGHYQMCDAGGPRPPRRYSVEAGGAEPSAGDGGLRDNALRDALADSVRAHLTADVPVGVFLSAGIDSAVLAALACQQSREVQALTVGFSEYQGSASDEVPLACSIANSLGMKHRVCYYSRDDFEQHLPQLLDAMDQPSIDGLNTWIVARACAESGLKSALSGLGADELFGGYPSFRDVPKWRRSSAWSRWIPGLGAMVRRGLKPLCRWMDISPKAAGMLEYGASYGGAYLLKRGLYMPWELPALMGQERAREGLARLGLIRRMNTVADQATDDLAKVSALEQGFYLRNQLLRDADWAGMAHSVEIRVPYVDTVLQQVAGSARFSKADLLACAATLLPQALGQRPKTGFTTPLSHWRGHPGPGWARNWAQELSCRF